MYVIRNRFFNPLNAKFSKWPNTLKQFVGKLPTNCLNVFGHFVGLALKGLIVLGNLRYLSMLFQVQMLSKPNVYNEGKNMDQLYYTFFISN